MEDQPSPNSYSETSLSLKLSYGHADDPDEPALSLGLPEPSASSSRRPSGRSALRIKREKEASDEEEDGGGGGARKKLRLSKEQAALLEDMFKEHSSLNTKQKQALAWQLKLLPRQVEVWFQNRRARTKLKKIEVEREILRKHCDGLREENKRLKKEVHELKYSSTTRFVQPPRAAFVICSLCKKVIDDDDGSVKAAEVAKPHRSFNPFARSTACYSTHL